MTYIALTFARKLFWLSIQTNAMDHVKHTKKSPPLILGGEIEVTFLQEDPVRDTKRRSGWNRHVTEVSLVLHGWLDAAIRDPVVSITLQHIITQLSRRYSTMRCHWESLGTHAPWRKFITAYVKANRRRRNLQKLNDMAFWTSQYLPICGSSSAAARTHMPTSSILIIPPLNAFQVSVLP